MVKGICQTAPAYIACQYFLFFRSGIAVLTLQLEQSLNSFNVPCELLLGTALTDMVIGNVVVACRNFGNSLGLDSCFNLADNLLDFGMLPSSNFLIILNDGIPTVLALDEIQAARKRSCCVHRSQSFHLRVRQLMVGSQGILKSAVLFQRQRPTDFQIICDIEVVNEVFRYFQFNEFYAIDLCMSFFIRVITIDTDILSLLLVINCGTVILKSVILHCAIHITLCGFFSFSQSLIVQLVIKAVFKVMVGYHLIRRSHAVGIAVDHFFRQPFRFFRNCLIQLTHFGNLISNISSPQMTFISLTITKEVFAVSTQTV